MEQMILQFCVTVFSTLEDKEICVQAMVNCVYKVEKPTHAEHIECLAEIDRLMHETRVKIMEE